MIDKAGQVAWAAEAVAVFQRHCGTSDEHAIADLICDLGHLADEKFWSRMMSCQAPRALCYSRLKLVPTNTKRVCQ
jgi:hypothetical protein